MGLRLILKGYLTKVRGRVDARSAVLEIVFVVALLPSFGYSEIGGK